MDTYNTQKALISAIHPDGAELKNLNLVFPPHVGDTIRYNDGIKAADEIFRVTAVEHCARAGAQPLVILRLGRIGESLS